MSCALKLAMLAVSLLALSNSANAANLVYGQVYYIQNGYANSTGGYLDANGQGSECFQNVYCVSTANWIDRGPGTGSWVIKSATGIEDGYWVNGNDQIYLVNQYHTPTYLDVAYSGCQGNLLCVSTSSTPNRGPQTGTWRIIKDQGATGPITEQSTVHLLNGYQNWSGGYLDTRGTSCQGNLRCVSTSSTVDRDNGSTTWRFFFPSNYRNSVVDLSASELMSLRRGVAKMMERNSAARGSADYRRSWIYWANMHQYFGDDCGGPIRGAGMNGVQTFSTQTNDETATWCKCEHGSAKFLTWHRMYLWYFERVLQQAAGNPSLRLPYWNYEKSGALPAAYRAQTYVDETGKTVPNPLYVQARSPDVNNGTSLDSRVTSTTAAIQETKYDDFNESLERTPHGAVHCAVAGSCQSGLMGMVPTAALDPIFYAHHANIDRLYECWLGALMDESGRLPKDTAQLDEQYTFVDVDGSTRTRRVRDMLTTDQLGYFYRFADEGCPTQWWDSSGPSHPGAAFVVIADPAPVTLVAEQPPLASLGATRLDRGVTTLPLAVAPAAREALAARQGGPAPARTLLVIEGLQYDEAPGGLYNVYLQSTGGRREQVGVIDFFNLEPSRSGGHAGHGQTRKNFRFDVTQALTRLNLGDGDAQPALVFEPTTGLVGSSPEAAARDISAQANVRFESARLVSRP